MSTNQTCDPGIIEKFFDDRLSLQQQREFEAHLEDCNDCRRQLESLAASDVFWSEAGNVLSGFKWLDLIPPGAIRTLVARDRIFR